MQKYMLGCKKDKRDDRDHLMRAYLPVVKLPKKVDHAKKMTPVRDQGDEGTCVGFASVAGVKEYQEKQDWKKDVALSPRFLYSLCKKLDGHPGEEGTQIRYAMKVLKTYGVCGENFWPYRPHQTDKPKKGYDTDAAKHKDLSYARLLDLDEVKLCLATKGPCIIGILCFDGIMKTRTGRVPMPKKGERPLGGHAICAAGYDEEKKLLKFKNSWSAAWGEKGYGYLPYAYVEKYMMDAWSSVDIKDASPLTIEKVLKHRV